MSLTLLAAWLAREFSAGPDLMFLGLHSYAFLCADTRFKPADGVCQLHVCSVNCPATTRRFLHSMDSLVPVLSEHVGALQEPLLSPAEPHP